MDAGAILGSAGLIWILIAVALVAGELLSPGVFLIFLAVGALATGLTTLAIPVPFLLQLLSFTAWSAVAVAIGRRWYTQFPVPSADPLLNDRAARMVGETVVVVEAISDGRGRVRIGDSEWLAAGADAPAGARVRVVAVRDSTVITEPLPPLAPPVG